MPNVLIRDLPPTVHERLKEQAESAGLSLQAHLVQVLTRQAEEMTPQEWIERVEAMLAATPTDGGTTMSAVEAVHEARAELDARGDRRFAEREKE